MSTQNSDIVDEPQPVHAKKENDLSLCYAYPIVSKISSDSSIITKDHSNPRSTYKSCTPVEDGLYASENPFTYNVIKPYQLNDLQALEYQTKKKFTGKLLEIAIREVVIHTGNNSSGSGIDITSVSILFKKKVICKTSKPFNRKLYKFLIRNSECDNLSIEVHTEDGQSSILPLLLPKRNVKDNKVDIEFAIRDNAGRIHAGTVTCTVSLSQHGYNKQEEHNAYMYKLSNDPNDPQNSLSLLRPQKNIHKEEVKYFLLEDPALSFDIQSENLPQRIQKEETKPPDIVVTEQPAFSLLDISFRDLLQARHPLRPSSSTRRHHTIGKSILTIIVLRGVEIPLREESALVQPLVEVEWGSNVQATFVSDGPAPVWQHTMNFELPRQNGEHCVKLRLFDQHPVWGQQWLGEARIPLEAHRNYQELERWIALSPLFSPVLLFGYVQASPGQAQTRIYVLMKLEQPGNAKCIESSAINTLVKGIQRCIATPYKVVGIEQPEEAARLTMLLPSLPIHYGPITPRQALNIRKVDHYGRASLLASLLQAFDLQAYVLLGSSQISKWSAFVLTIVENGNHILWDPEIGHYFTLGDNRCSLMKVSRLINHSNIWENLQKSILPHNLKYDLKSSKDWRPSDSNHSSTANRVVQTIDLNITEQEERQIKESCVETEQYLKDKLSEWRSVIGLTTTFNRHAVNLLRKFISKAAASPNSQLDKKDLKKLYRSYHTHGFVLNTRQFGTDKLAEQLNAMKVHAITGPVEFALVCYLQHYVGKIYSLWLSVMILRGRN